MNTTRQSSCASAQPPPLREQGPLFRLVGPSHCVHCYMYKQPLLRVRTTRSTWSVKPCASAQSPPMHERRIIVGWLVPLIAVLITHTGSLCPGCAPPGPPDQLNPAPPPAASPAREGSSVLAGGPHFCLSYRKYGKSLSRVATTRSTCSVRPCAFAQPPPLRGKVALTSLGFKPRACRVSGI